MSHESSDLKPSLVTRVTLSCYKDSPGLPQTVMGRVWCGQGGASRYSRPPEPPEPQRAPLKDKLTFPQAQSFRTSSQERQQRKWTQSTLQSSTTLRQGHRSTPAHIFQRTSQTSVTPFKPCRLPLRGTGGDSCDSEHRKGSWSFWHILCPDLQSF